MDSDKLIELLREGIVEIQFRSLKSNKTHKREYTTHKSFMPSLKNQSASDKILCYDVESVSYTHLTLPTNREV